LVGVAHVLVFDVDANFDCVKQVPEIVHRYLVNRVDNHEDRVFKIGSSDEFVGEFV
jgi:hypothetical protein